MGKEILGEFEHHVLLATVRLGDGAYSASIVEELETETERSPSAAAVYIALRRLEEGAFVVDAEKDGAVQEELESKMVDGARLIGTGRPSLAQDVARGRKTEVEFLNGYVSRRGREVGVPTPVNDSVVKHTKRLEAGDIPQAFANVNLID